jgi:hypothetical protein
MVHQALTDETANCRTPWLAEIAEALEAARLLVGQLAHGDPRLQLAEIQTRIENVSALVSAMRLTRARAMPDFDREWTEATLWQRSA